MISSFTVSFFMEYASGAEKKKVRQYNGKKKKVRQYNGKKKRNDLQNTAQKTKD
jgi:hypothetical protein